MGIRLSYIHYDIHSSSAAVRGQNAEGLQGRRHTTLWPCTDMTECQPRAGPHATLPIFHIIGAMRAANGTLWPTSATDGNAIFAYRGVFHVMHQTTHDTPAGATVPTHATWGHVVSHDLVRWRRVDDALAPTAASSAYDWHDGDCDGTVTLDSNGLSEAPIMTFGPDCARYASNDAPRVGIALPADPADPLLVSWHKDKANPIVFAPGSPPCSFSGRIWRSHVRPEVINMVCCINSQSNAWGRYTTMNTTLHGPWKLVDASFATWHGPGGNRTIGSISAPSFLPLPSAASSANVTHIINAGGGASFYLGRYDRDAERLNLAGELQHTESGWASWFVAGAAGTRVLQIGFIFASPYNASYTRLFAHTCYDPLYVCFLTSIRELTYDATSASLLANPISEYKTLRNGTLAELRNVQLEPRKPLWLPLPEGTGAEMDLEIDFTLGRGALFTGVHVLTGATNTAKRATSLHINISAPSSTDRTRQANVTLVAPRVSLNVYSASIRLRAEEHSFSLRLLVDRSIVEVFAGSGRAVLTTRDYPKVDETAVQVWSTDRAVVSNIAAWSMGCGWA